MRSTPGWVLLTVGLLALAACDAVQPSNPYDPTSTNPARGRATGRIASDDGGVPAGAIVTLRAAAAEASFTAPVAEDGGWTLELAPGDYTFVATAPSYGEASFPGIRVHPGLSTDTGRVVLARARGTIEGRVRLEDGKDPGGTRVMLIPEGSGDPLTGEAGADGRWLVQAVPEGKYVVRASRADYAPAYATNQQVLASRRADIGEFVLRPATAVVRAEVKGVQGARFTNERRVRVLLLTFGAQVDRMMVSADPRFADSALGDVEWRAYAPELEFDLPDADGAHTIHARFKDAYDIETQSFSTSITLDRALPTIAAASAGDGSGYVRRPDAAVPVVVDALDPLSGIAAWALAADGVVDTEAFNSIDSTAGATRLEGTLSVTPERGPRTFAALVRDRAGNVSEPFAIEVFVDASAPRTGTPAVAIEGGAPVVHSRVVALTFDVTGDDAEEPIFVATASASGIPELTAYAPVDGPMPYELAPGADGARQVCARFRDWAGNVTGESCASTTLDTTGRVLGTVSLEGDPTTLSGVVATLSSDVDPLFTRTANTDETGRFTLGGVPEGFGYVLSLAREGWRTQVVRGLAVAAGLDTEPQVPQLALARGSLSGYATLNDRPSGEHGGITVALANTPYATVTAPDGAFLLRDVPTGTYDVIARQQGYLPASYGSALVAAERTLDLGSRQLRRQSGTFAICLTTDPTCSRGSAEYTSSRNVILQLVSATATQYRAGLGAELAGVEWSPLVSGQTAYTFTLADLDGSQAVYVQYRSSDGTAQPVLESRVVLDRAAPTDGEVLIDADARRQSAAYTADSAGNVMLTLSARDALSGVAKVVVSNEDAVFDETAQAIRSPLEWTLRTATDGAKKVFVSFCDAAGNCTDAQSSPSRTIILDRAAPTAAQGYAFVIQAGATVTGSPQVALDFTLGADAAAVRFGSTSSLSGAAWLPVDAASGTTVSFSHLLPAGDGTHTVYAQFADLAGNVSTLSPAAFSDTIVLDTEAPQAPRVTLPGGGYWNQATIEATLSATGTPTQMQVVVGDAEDWSSATWIAFAAKRTVSLASDRAWKVYARFRDAAGNVSSTSSAEVIRDTAAPTKAAVTIDEGAYARTQLVNLRLQAVDTYALEMQLASDGAFDTEAWEPYTAAAAFTLVPAAQPSYTVKARFRDRAGNLSDTASATVALDTQVPTVAVTINGASSGQRTNRTDVTLGITASDNVTNGIAKVEYSNSSDFAGAVSSTYATTYAWRLDASGGDGLKTVYVRVTDRAGNTATASATITLDTPPPAGTVSVAQGTLVRSTSVTLNLTRDPDVRKIAVANGALDCAGATYEDYPVSNTKAWTLASGDGAKTVVVCFRDEAGNAAPATATTTLDATAPAAATSGAVVVVNDGATRTSAARVGVRLLVSGADFMRVSCDDALDGEAEQPFLAEITCDLASIQGTRTVTATFRDAAGNTYAPPVATIVLDSLAPAAPTLVAVATPTSASTIAFKWSHAAPSDVASYLVQVADNAQFSPLALETSEKTTSLDYAAREGSWYWRVAAVDATGNQGPFSTSGAFVVDRTVPSMPLPTVAGATETSITLSWAAPGDDKDTGNLDAGSTYQVRYTSAASFDWSTATAATGLPTPGARGATETFELTGLVRKTTYFVGLRVCDDAGNCSPVPTLLLRSAVKTSTADTTPPSAITDLKGTPGTFKVTLTWTNPGDDGATGDTVKRQTVFYRPGPLVTEDDFALADRVDVKPGAPGTTGTATITSLMGNTRYSFAVRSFDVALNDSGSSNVLSIQMTRVLAIRPEAASPGEWVELDGINFGFSRATVSFNGLAATSIDFWNNTLVRVQVPEDATSGLVTIERGVVESDGLGFIVAPAIDQLFPKETLAGEKLYLSGTNFGPRVQAGSGLRVGGATTASSSIPDWQDDGFSANLATNTAPGIQQVRVARAGHESRAAPIRVWSPASEVTTGSAHSYVWGAAVSPVEGNAHVLMMETDPTNSNVKRYRYKRWVASTGTWDGVVDPLGISTGALGGDLDVDANGDVHMCFSYVSGTTQRIVYRKRTAAGSWGSLVYPYALSTATAPLGECRIAAPVYGGQSYPLIVWTVGYWSAVLYPSDLYASASANGGSTFSTAAQVCPFGSTCTGSSAYESYPEVVGIDGTYGAEWHLAFQRRSGASGARTLQFTKSGYTGNSSAPFNFSAAVTVAAPISGSSDERPALAQVRGDVGWYGSNYSMLAWAGPGSDGLHGAMLARSTELLGGSWSPDQAIEVDSSTGESAPALAVTRDGDVSVLVVDDEESTTEGEFVVKHHLGRWTGSSGRWTEMNGESIVGLTTLGQLVAAGGAKGAIHAFWYSGTGATYPVVKAARTVLPWRETTATTVATAAAGRAFVAPQSVVGTDGTIHTALLEQAEYPTSTSSLLLRYLTESDAGTVTGPTTIDSVTSNLGCTGTAACADRLAIALPPSGGPAIAFVKPAAVAASQALRLCVNAPACTPISVATGDIRRVTMAADASGALHLVWAALNERDETKLFYARHSGGSLGPTVPLSADAGSSFDPAIVIPPSGTPHVVYVREFGSRALRVRTVNADLTVGPAVDLVTSSSAIERPSAHWTRDGIALMWLAGGKNMMFGRWAYGWVDSPVRVTSGTASWALTGDPYGQLFLHLDTADEQEYDYYFTRDDLLQSWRGPSTWASLSDATRRANSVCTDPRGRLNLYAGGEGFMSPGGPLKRLRYWMGSW